MTYLRKVWAIVRKDLTTELRSRELLSTMGAFSVLVILLFAFAFDLRVARAGTVAPGALWSVIAFAGILGLGRSIGSEIDRGVFDALLLTPVDRSAIFFGKAVGIILFMFVVEAAILPLFVIFFNLPFLQPTIIFIVMLGTVGYGGIGTLLSTMSANTRLREVLLPVLLLPLSLPLVLPASMAVAAYMFPQLPAFGEVQSAISIVLLYDLLMLSAGFLTYHYVVES